MTNLRSTRPHRAATDSLSRLALNKRTVQLIGATNEKTPHTAAPRAAATAQVAAAAAAQVSRDEDEDMQQRAAAPARRAVAATGRAAARGVRTISHTAGRAVRGGIIAQRHRAAVKTGARAAATVAVWVKGLAVAVVGAVASVPVLAILVGVLIVVTLVVSLISFLMPGSAAACEGGAAGGNVDPAAVPATAVAGYGHEQLVNAAHIMQAAEDRGLSVREQTIGVMTAMGESGLRILDHGDTAGPDSRGLFQQRDSWGTLADRMDPYISAGKFFDAMVQKVPEADRQSLAPTLVAHQVQINADPYYYYEPFWAPATAVAAALSGRSVAGSGGGAGLCGSGPLPAGEVGVDGWARPGAGPITADFGPRPVLQTPSGPTIPFHHGLDLQAGGCGGPIWAAKSGTVSRVFADSGGTWVLEIEHGNGLQTRYLHMWADGIFVTPGETVQAGQQIATVGSSGFSTGCHLHFAVHHNGTAVDPIGVLENAGITYEGSTP